MRGVLQVLAGLVVLGCSIERGGLGGGDGALDRDAAGHDGSRGEGGTDGAPTAQDGGRDAERARDGSAEAPDGPLDAGFDPCRDAPIPETFELCPFGTPTRITALSDAARDDDPTITADLRELYFNTHRSESDGDIWVSRRASPADPWGTPSPVGELNSAWAETTPEIAPDGLTIWFSSNRPAAIAQHDIFVSTRPDRSSSWSAPEVVVELSTTAVDVSSALSADGLHVTVSVQVASNDWDIWSASRPSRSSSWTTIAQVPELSTSAMELDGYFAPDAHHLFFDGTVVSAEQRDLFVVSRPDLGSPFGTAVPIAGANSDALEEDVWISQDLRYIAFASDRAGDLDLWEASR